MRRLEALDSEAIALARAQSATVHAPSPAQPLSGLWCTGGATAAAMRGRRQDRASSRVVVTCLACRERADRDATALVVTAAVNWRVTEATMERNVIAWLLTKGLR